MKVSIANLLKTTDTPNNLIVQQLIKSGYPLDYSKKLVDDVSDEMEEEDYYASKKRRDKKKKSMLDSKLIEEDDARREKKRMEEDELTEARNKKTKALGEDAVNAIEEEHETEEEENEDSDQELLEEFNEDDELLMNDNDAVSEEALDLATAQYGMEMKDDNYRIQWPGMEMDLSTLRYGGMPNKNKFINSTVKQLRKAEMGMEKDPSIGKNPNPYGTIDNPLGENLTPNKSLVSAIKGSAQSFVNEERYKKQAEQMYNQQFMQPQAENGGANDWATNLHNYGEALSHEMPNVNTTGMNTDFSGQQMAFGGTSRRVRRANRGMFGTPIAPPFVDTDYEFGPFGGVRKAQATYDMSKLSELMKNNPNYLKEYMANAQQSGPNLKNVWNWWTSNSPGFNFNQSYMTTRTVSSAPKTRLKWTTEKINDAADPSKNNEVKLTNNPVTTDQTKKYQDYIDWWSSLGPAASGRGKAAPISINEFIAKGADGLSEYDSWVSRAPSTSVSTRAAQPKANLTDEEILNYNKFASESQDQAISSTIPSAYAPITNKSIAPINTPVPRNEDVDFLNSDRFSDENLDESLMYPQDESYMMNTQESSLPAASNASAANSSSYSLTPNQTGSQTEEFCYPGQSCYNLSDDQSWDRNIFNELPEALTAYGSTNKSDWFTDDEQFNKTKLDLSKVTKKEAIEAIKSRIPKEDLPRMKNLDEYIEKWLKFQKENQKAYGSTNTTDLYDYDFSGDSPKYADWLNVSGKAGAQNPYDIFSATPALDFEDYEKAFGGPIVGVQPDQYGNLQKFIYGGDEYAYGGALNMFPDGGEQVDPAYKDARGMNYQDYIDRHSELASKQVNNSPNSTYTGAYSTAAPQTWAEWKAEQEAEKNPNASTTTTTTNTGTTTNNTGTGSYDKSYFDKLFSSDPNAKKGFEEYLRSQGLPTNDQLKQNQGNMTYTNSAGNPVVGYGPAKQNFGSMIGSMFGLTKDFNYYTSPDGQIDQAMIAQMMKDPTKNITKSQYKEGKWWNPFDKDKKITKWEVMNATGNAANTNNTNTNTTNTNTTNTNTNPGWKGYPYALPGDENKSTTNTGTTSTAQVNGAGPSQPRKSVASQYGFSEEKWDNMSWRDQTDAMNAIDDQTPAPTRPITVGAGSLQSNPNNSPVDSDNPYVQDAKAAAEGKGLFDPNSVNIPGNNPRPNMAFPQNQPGAPVNEQGVIRRQYGGYIPAYMAYGGYMPDYGYGGMTYFNPGGVVGPNPEFAGPQENNFGADADNNGVADYLEVKDGKSEMAINNVGTTQDKEGPTSYTLEEQTAKTLDLGVGARTVNKGVAGLTNLLQKAKFAKKRQTQNPKFMYAQDIDRQLTYKGRADQEGVDKKAGFETGRTFTKMGGAQNTNESKAYSKGKVYSLTMDEIREIQRNGGSVKFIK
jgi:hypothetical protein